MNKSFIIAIVLSCNFFFQCGNDQRDSITLRIFSFYQSFTGSYTVDNGTAVTIASEFSFDTGIGNVIHYSEYELGEIDSLSVSIVASNTANFLAIRVYKDGEKVKESINSSVSSLSLTYEYDE